MNYLRYKTLGNILNFWLAVQPKLSIFPLNKVALYI